MLRNRAARVLALHVVFDDRLKLLGDAVSLERHRALAVDEHRRHRRLARPGQADADVGVLALARSVDHAAHHGDVHRLDAGILSTPYRHLVAQVVLDLLRQLLEEGAGGAAAPGTGDHHRRERAQPHGLQDLLRDLHFLGARLTGGRRERHADRVADAFLQQHRQRRGGGDDALAAHAGLREAQVQRVVATARQFAIHRDQILHAADLGRQHDHVAAQAQLLGALRVLDRRAHQRLAQHCVRLPRLRALRVLVHHLRQQFLIERAPVDADAHRLVMARGDLDHPGEVVFALRTTADVAGIDAVGGQRLRAARIVDQQLVAVVVEVTHQRHVDAHAIELIADRLDLGRGFGRVDGDPHHLAAGLRQFLHLNRGADRVGRVGVGHRLHHHRRVAAAADHAAAPANQHLARARRASGPVGAGRQSSGMANEAG